LFWLARMLESGDDAKFIARRLVILASEDIGMADPNALVVAVAAAGALEHVGLPEAQLNLAQAVVYLATAPKSNRVALGIWSAREDIRRGVTARCQPICAMGTMRARASLVMAWAINIRTIIKGGWVDQQYMPDSRPGSPQISGDYYKPSTHGNEKDVAERMSRLEQPD